MGLIDKIKVSLFNHAWNSIKKDLLNKTTSPDVYPKVKAGIKIFADLLGRPLPDDSIKELDEAFSENEIDDRIMKLELMKSELVSIKPSEVNKNKEKDKKKEDDSNG